MFSVHPAANRRQIKDAVESSFGVTALKVNTLNVKPRVKKRSQS